MKGDKLTPSEKARITKGHLKNLTEYVDVFLSTFDDLMREPASFQRGKKLGRLVETLDMQNQVVKHYGLGLPLENRGDRPTRPVPTSPTEEG